MALAAGAQSSPVGRAKTLPGGSETQARLAVFSCANYPTGCFHAHADTAKREDLDVVSSWTTTSTNTAPAAICQRQCHRAC